MAKVREREMPKKDDPEEGDPGKHSARTYFRRVLNVDIVKMFEELKTIAELPADQLKDRMALTRMINTAAGNAWRANLIYLKARTEVEMFKVEMDRKTLPIMLDATEDLSDEIKKRDMKKQITEGMVKQQMANNEEYTALVREEQELKEMRDSCLSLSQQWTDRKGLLQTQAKLVAAELEVKLGGLDRQGEDR